MRKEAFVRTQSQRAGSMDPLPSPGDLAQAKKRATNARTQATRLQKILQLERQGGRRGLASAYVYAHPLWKFLAGVLSTRRELCGPRPQAQRVLEPVFDSEPTSFTLPLLGHPNEEEIQRFLLFLESRASAAEARHRQLVRAIQSEAGARRKEQAPEVLAAVQRAIRGNPDLTPRAFFDGIGENGIAIYKTMDERGREVLMQERDERTVSFATVQRYFTKARKGRHGG